MTLAEFLLARIAEDETLARSAIQARYVEYKTSPEWVYDGNPSGAFAALRQDSKDLAAAVIIGQASSWDDSLSGGGRFARHIVNWDPARVLTECQAKRLLVNAHGRDHSCISLSGSGDHSVVDDEPWELWELEHTGGAPEWGIPGGPCFVLRALALPFADHSDYQQDWRP